MPLVSICGLGIIQTLTSEASDFEKKELLSYETGFYLACEVAMCLS
jgi:hypothetical protein